MANRNRPPEHPARTEIRETEIVGRIRANHDKISEESLEIVYLRRAVMQGRSRQNASKTGAGADRGRDPGHRLEVRSQNRPKFVLAISKRSSMSTGRKDARAGVDAGGST